MTTTLAITSTTETLEKLIDSQDLLHVVTGLEIVCGEKAQHIRTNWQDIVTARAWEIAERRFAKLAREIEALSI